MVVVMCLSRFYPMSFIHCSALLSTAEKALYKFYIILHYELPKGELAEL